MTGAVSPTTNEGSVSLTDDESGLRRRQLSEFYRRVVLALIFLRL